MNDEVANSSSNDFKDYNPVELTLGVWWNMKAEGTRSSVTVKMSRDCLKFYFRTVDEAGTKTEVIKKLRTTEVYMFTRMFRAFLADRMALAKQHFESETEGPVPYSVIPELNCQINNCFFSKESNGFVNTSNMTLGTVEVNGVQRVALSVHTNDGKNIRVVFYEESAHDLVQISKLTVIDPEDLEFYHFCMEIENSLNKTVEYAGFDKIYQMLKRLMDGNGNVPEKKGLFSGGFFKKKNAAPKIAVNDSGNDADADLFGGSDSTF